MISTSYHQECLCGRSFDDSGAFTRHKKNCVKGKKRLADVLSHVKDSYHSKKCRIEGDGKSASFSSKTTSLNAVSHTVDDTGDTAPGLSDSLHSSIETTQPIQARMSRADQVCIHFCFGFI